MSGSEGNLMSSDESLNFPKNDAPSPVVRSAASSPPPATIGMPAIAGTQPRNMDSLEFVMDVPIEVSVEIGRKKMRIAEILRIGAGSVLELNKTAGEPLDIYVNNRIVARGEAVVVGDHYGVRLTEVLIADEGRSRGDPR
jgi:flagellar motor switch protein FliN/FliY